MIPNSLIERLLDSSSPRVVTLVLSVFSSFLSIFVVYSCTYIFNEEYSEVLFKMSVILPLIITPLVVSVLIRINKHLKYTKEHLIQEIEESKKKDVILFEQARFVLMGEMLANISHQWKQPLNTINLSILSAKTSVVIPPELDRNFDIIEDNVNFLASTIDDFMSFFDKRTHLELKTLDELIKEIYSIIGSQVSNRDITLYFKVEESAKKIRIASSISQVVLNLLNNAKDAFDDAIQDKRIDIVFKVEDEILEIRCSDNGKGIPQGIKEKIFDPYFTTKDKSQGTGLGLYMSKQIVQKLFNGTIQVFEGENCKYNCSFATCFFIEIPYSEKCIVSMDEA